ncbi:Phage related integrase [Acetobacter malorum]|uniref:Phage related integrase n=1 Tax=Acetobacter malorum TaxID=178901 RepID=A0A177GE36_9PROT|nr:Phage related integrase [Acetobacter malorum]
MGYAIDKGWRQDNPIASVKIKRRKSEGIHPWTDAEIEQYLAQWPPGTPHQIAAILGHKTLSETHALRGPHGAV